MIEKIEIMNFRAIRYASVRLSPFQVLVGPNASGKSTFFDAIHLVRDILNVGLEAAFFGDLRFGIQQRCANPTDLTWMRQGDPMEFAFTIRLPESLTAKSKNNYTHARYELSIKTREDAKDVLQFNSEVLWLCQRVEENKTPIQRTMFPEFSLPKDPIVKRVRTKTPSGWRKIINKIGETGNDHFLSETSEWNNLFRLGAARSALANLPEDEEKFPASTWVKRFLMEGSHRIALNAEAMRLPCRPAVLHSFLPDGSNLPLVVHDLEKNHPERLTDWIEHIKTALEDVASITTVEKPEDRSRYIEITYNNGLKAPSWLLSDGTLRALALTLMAYVPSGPSLILIEEPENGIHPRAVEAVIQSMSSVYDAQLFCATHSPLVLGLVELKSLLCFGKTRQGAVDVVRGPEHPQLREWRSSLHLGELFATGVLG